MKRIIYIFMASMFILTGCTQETQISDSTQTNTAKYQKITPEEAKNIMDTQKDIIILDVRTREEFDEGHIDNALLLAQEDFEARAGEVLPKHDSKILVYCRSGRRSESAAKKLIEMGYTNIYDFGGIADWKY